MEKKEDLIIVEYELKTYETLPSNRKDRKSKFAIFVDGELVGLVNSPAYDGARLLVKLGYDPDRLMTTKSVESDCLSWTPQPIRKFAKLTVKERDKSGLAVEGFSQFPGVGMKSAFKGFYEPTYLNSTEREKTATRVEATP